MRIKQIYINNRSIKDRNRCKSLIPDGVWCDQMDVEMSEVSLVLAKGQEQPKINFLSHRVQLLLRIERPLFYEEYCKLYKPESKRKIKILNNKILLYFICFIIYLYFKNQKMNNNRKKLEKGKISEKYNKWYNMCIINGIIC